MKLFIVISALIVVAISAPLLESFSDAKILKYENNKSGIDGYNFAYETSDGISRQEQGSLQDIGSDVGALRVHGSYSFTTPDGQTFTVTFVADENGFRALGDHLPVAPKFP